MRSTKRAILGPKASLRQLKKQALLSDFFTDCCYSRIGGLSMPGGLNRLDMQLPVAVTAGYHQEVRSHAW